MGRYEDEFLSNKLDKFSNDSRKKLCARDKREVRRKEGMRATKAKRQQEHAAIWGCCECKGKAKGVTKLNLCSEPAHAQLCDLYT